MTTMCMYLFGKIVFVHDINVLGLLALILAWMQLIINQIGLAICMHSLLYILHIKGSWKNASQFTKGGRGSSDFVWLFLYAVEVSVHHSCVPQTKCVLPACYHFHLLCKAPSYQCKQWLVLKSINLLTRTFLLVLCVSFLDSRPPAMKYEAMWVCEYRQESRRRNDSWKLYVVRLHPCSWVQDKRPLSCCLLSQA